MSLDSILESRDITLPTKVRLVKAMVFPVVMYGCESWAVKKVEHRKIDAFELWCWRRLLRVLWTARRSNQSILKEISPGCSFEGLMLKLKLQYFGHLLWQVDSLEKTLMLGGIGGTGEGDDRGWDGWMASLAWWAWVWVNSRSLWWTGRPSMLRFMELQRVGHDWATELNWIELLIKSHHARGAIWASKKWVGPWKIITHDIHQFLPQWPWDCYMFQSRFTLILHYLQTLEWTDIGKMLCFKFVAVFLVSLHRLEKDSFFWGNLEPNELRLFLEGGDVMVWEEKKT